MVAADGLLEAGLCPGVRCRGAAQLGQVIAWLRGDAELEAPPDIPPATGELPADDLLDVRGQAAAKRMLERGRGTIQFTGASASVKGYANSAPFAMGKFGLRGLAQSMARELHPQNVHVAHFVIDGGVRNAKRGRVEAPDAPDSFLDPAAVAETYMHVLGQPRSVWSWEVELRPWVERF